MNVPLALMSIAFGLMNVPSHLSMSDIGFVLALITALTLFILFVIWIAKELEEGCDPICMLCGLLEIPAEWISNFIARRKTASSTPSPELPPSERAGDAGMGADIATGFGENKTRPVLQKIRNVVPFSGNDATFARLDFSRKDGVAVDQAFANKKCLLREFPPLESNDSDLSGKHPHIRYLHGGHIPVSRWNLDGLDITLNKGDTSLPLIELNFHPNKTHPQANDIAPDGKNQADNATDATEQCNAN